MKCWTVVLTLDAQPITAKPNAIDVRATLMSGNVVSVSTAADTELGNVRTELAKAVGLPPQILKLVTPSGRILDDSQDGISVADGFFSELNANISSALLRNGGLEPASHSEDGGIVASPRSFRSADGQYFLSGTLLTTPTGTTISVEHLEVGNLVLAASGSVLRVAKVQLHQADEVEEFTTSSARHPIGAPRHRVFTQSGQATYSARLSCWDRVLVTGVSNESAVDMPTFAETTDVYELAFCPDELVEAFQLPTSQEISWSQLSAALGFILSNVR